MLHIGHPNESRIAGFIQTQRNIRQQSYNTSTGNLVVISILCFSAMFGYTIFKAIGPYGLARRLIYDKSGPRWAMYLRKMGPGIVGMSAFVLADIITGVWDEPKSSI